MALPAADIGLGAFNAVPGAELGPVREQAGVADAEDSVRRGLAEGNRDYERRFGHVYLVSAVGRGARELLELLGERLANDPATERAVLRQELAKINRLRLERLVGYEA